MQNHLSKHAHLILQNATPLWKSAPWLPNISHEHVFCIVPATKMHLCRSSSNVPCLPSFLEMLQNPHVLITFDKVHNPLHLPRETTSEPPNSKSGANIWCFAHFDFEMCFAPQRRALFRHRDVQKWSERGVLCTFWLGNVLRATTACTFSTSRRPKVVRTWCALYILTWKCASRHNGVHFFDISTAKVVRSWFALYILTWKCASRHNGVHSFDISTSLKSLEKHSVSRLSYLFTHLHLVSSDSFSSTLLSSNLSLLSASSLLCFSSVHIVGSLTSKLPSNNGRLVADPAMNKARLYH